MYTNSFNENDIIVVLWNPCIQLMKYNLLSDIAIILSCYVYYILLCKILLRNIIIYVYNII